MLVHLQHTDKLEGGLGYRILPSRCLGVQEPVDQVLKRGRHLFVAGTFMPTILTE